ncbi:uncharacterized protein LOC131664298 [Phymastichus coffea]|uniref:uncharacterized protein LOC131664298 n=1 Tax=Phymastichus coffea TaxID=108790 RepID=UPI00273B7ADC|nr:uncharacterized protein LOC131664298 [Phymastichus coffea]
MHYAVLILVALALVVNEAMSWEIEKSALIARPAAAGFVPHQQSTNTPATRRDLQYKRHSRNPRTIVGDASTLYKKRILPGQINDLDSRDEDGLYYGRDTFQAPKIVYVNTRLPEPFARPEQRERIRVFGFNSFPIKDRTLMRPSSFKFVNNAAQDSKIEARQTEKPQTNENIPVISQQLVAMIADDLRDESSRGYALYHRIINEEDGNLSTSFKENSVSDDNPSAPHKSKNLDDELPADWDVNEAQPDDSRDFSLVGVSEGATASSRESSELDDSKYEFGYRVIDQAAGSDYGHEESHRPEGGVTNGRYHVRLPDGRVQRVEYSADHRGYHAQVSYLPGQ